MRIDRLAALLKRAPPLPRGIEFERPPRFTEPAAPVEPGICPRCDRSVSLAATVCSACGFPFVCDVTAVDAGRATRRNLAWRTVLGAAVLVFALTNALFVTSGSQEYQGQTSRVISGLTPATDSGIPVTGPEPFVQRTQLALGLLKQRAPDFYLRMRAAVTSIEYLGQNYLESGEHDISLEGIGAVSTPATGRVQVLLTTAFPSGIGEYWDYDVFSYAGVLVHELRHIELHEMGTATGGWQEEVECERAAYGAVKQMDAPGAILARYELYLAEPTSGRYQKWYDWYRQQE